MVVFLVGFLTLLGPTQGLVVSSALEISGTDKHCQTIIHFGSLDDTFLHLIRAKECLHVLILEDDPPFSIDLEDMWSFIKILNSPNNQSSFVYLLDALMSDTNCPKRMVVVEKTESTEKALNECTIPFNSRVYLTEAEHVNKSIIVSEIYQVSSSLPSVVTRLGYAKDFLEEEDHDVLERRMQMMKGLSWKVGYVLYAPMLYEDENTLEPYGFNYEVWKIIENALNVSTTLVKANAFGALAPSGNWSGLVGMLQWGEVDVSLTTMSTTFARSLVVDYLDPVADISFSLATYAHKDLLGSPLAVLSQEVYVALGWLWSLCSGIAILTFLSRRTWETSLSEICVLSLGSLTNQGMERCHFQLLSNKVLFLSQFFCAILILAMFSARLTSNLTVREPDPLIRSLQDVHQMKYNLYIDGGGNTESVFKNALPGTTHNAVWETQLGTQEKFRKKSGSLSGFADDPKAVAFTSHFRVLVHMLENRNACDLKVKKIETRIFSMAARKGFWYTELINQQLTKMRESGVLRQLISKYLEPASRQRDYICSSRETEDILSVGMTNILKFFYFIFVGIISSFISFALEHAVKKWPKKENHEILFSTRRLKRSLTRIQLWKMKLYNWRKQ